MLGGGSSGDIVLSVNFSQVAALNSPIFSGNPSAPNPLIGDNSNFIATTHWVNEQNYSVNGGAVWGNISGDISNQSDLQSILNTYATLISPVLIGSPHAPLQSLSDSTTLIATDQWVKSQGYFGPSAIPPTDITAGTNGTCLETISGVVTWTSCRSGVTSGTALLHYCLQEVILLTFR